LHGAALAVGDDRHHLVGMTFLDQLTSDNVLDTAYDWLRRRRREYSANADVWAFRRCWSHEKEQIRGELHSGSFRFLLLSRITLKDGENTDLWLARDALVWPPLRLRCTSRDRSSGPRAGKYYQPLLT
jgi:hypothetical protein